MKYITKKIKKTEPIDSFVARGGVIQKIKTKVPKEYKHLIAKQVK